jgi:hypothetical protein
LYVAGELSPEARLDVERHAVACEACAEILLAEKSLRGAIAAHGDSAVDKLDGSGLLLAQCRSELAEALDDRDLGVIKAGWRERFSPARLAAEFRRAMSFHPGWSTAALLLAGALGGMLVRTWYSETSLPLPGRPAMTVSAAPRLTDQELETMGIQGIHLVPQDGGPFGSQGASQVNVQLLSEQPVNVQGTLDDADIRRLLIYVVAHGQRFDPGVRLDSMEALRSRVADPEVQAALCAAVRQDDNPAVRLKALETLEGRGSDHNVQQTILGALSQDDNAGVRIEAVNSLLAAVGGDELHGIGSDAQALDILRDRERNDPNSYVRLRSAAALSRLASLDSNGEPHP